MDRPICDFVEGYAGADCLRLHMPGHKGRGPLGLEARDITEIYGADSLFHAEGIIRDSEKIASKLFGAESFYSTEGSSLCIRAMLKLALDHGRRNGRSNLVLAGRNAHKAFISAAALLDIPVSWLGRPGQGGYLSCRIDPKELEEQLGQLSLKPAALYITSPDYLGNMADVRALARVCSRHGVLLLVDNAHGAYLKFLPQSRHPMDLGADLCCDSAHKTLPVLTGGAYLHVARRHRELAEGAKDALGLFASTSPSYLILQSLDGANPCLQREFPQRLGQLLPRLELMKKALRAKGWQIVGDEPMKLSLETKPMGYYGHELEELLRQRGIICEFADRDYLVMMPSPWLEPGQLRRMFKELMAIEPRQPIEERQPKLPKPRQVMSIRQAALAPQQRLPLELCEGRVLGATAISCPPAVSLLVCGEEIDRQAIACFKYYGISHCQVVER